jgi:type IV secretory pathway TrbD component
MSETERLMAKVPNFHPVYRSLNKPLTIWGAERSLFFLAAVMGAASFNFFGSLLGGLLMFVALFLVARWSTITDPQLLRILLNSAKFRTQYDPAKFASSKERRL